MSDYSRGGLNFEEEDRLPWLEPAQDDDVEEGVAPMRLAGFILGGLLLLGLIVGGVYFLRSLNSNDGSGELIAAPRENYKIPASEADAKKFQGVGDSSFSTSEGVERDGKIDPSRLPEAPLATAPAATGKGSNNADAVMAKNAAAPKPAAKVSAQVADGTKADKKAAAPVAKANGGSAQIQLGAYGSAAMAKDAWGKLSKRFDYLAALGSSVEPVEVGNTTLYRLRAGVGSASNANALCGKLKVAGESCMVVN
ncbi:SPOR domain-containing protein [Sphingobium subterraneum]|uniref:SPOR domain-containing protein n=1 Tax=Sphingobium subterraneum TaxID=627688 RepID=A0A841IY35_9SPHN|nr:SPOR domain-containing protein [Sphingobium subterraneum]MBB6123527.1 hypothetical protein [Sphingobium subterraneum]